MAVSVGRFAVQNSHLGFRDEEKKNSRCYCRTTMVQAAKQVLHENRPETKMLKTWYVDPTMAVRDLINWSSRSFCPSLIRRRRSRRINQAISPSRLRWIDANNFSAVSQQILMGNKSTCPTNLTSSSYKYCPKLIKLSSIVFSLVLLIQ